MAELEHELESAHHESQDRAVEVTEAWVVEWVTTTKWRLEEVKVHHAEIKVAL